MQKIFILLCSAIIWLCCTSSKEYITDNNESIFPDGMPNPQIESLIRQARQGKVEAYDSLAICYRDGNGVKQCDFNMLTMHILSLKKRGYDETKVIHSAELTPSLRLLIEVLNHPRMRDVPQDSIAKLRNISPADALIYDAISALECNHDTIASLQFVQKAVAQGSNMASIMELTIYELLGDKEKLEQNLHKYARKFPILYVKLGEFYMQDDSADHLEKAVKYFNLADKYGMLTIKGARSLSTTYRMLEKEGKTICDPQEMARLERLSQQAATTKGLQP